MEDVGTEVGPDLLSALRNKTPDQLVIDVLDPSREVDPRYVNYQVTTTSGRSVSGLLAVETPTSITLRRGEKRWRDGYGLARVTETHAPDPGRDEFRVRYKNLGVTDSAWGGTAVLDELQAGI